VTTSPAGKIVLITGASSGIGEATARHLADAGHHVVLGARRVERLAALVDELSAAGHSAEYAELDVTSLDSVRAFVDAALERHGQADVLVNNAGISPGFTQSELANQGGHPDVQRAARDATQQIGIPASAIAAAIGYAISQPSNVDVSELIVRPTAQN